VTVYKNLLTNKKFSGKELPFPLLDLRLIDLRNTKIRVFEAAPMA
jgi:hypothetical protein